MRRKAGNRYKRESKGKGGLKIFFISLDVLRQIWKTLEDASVKSYLWNVIHREEQEGFFHFSHHSPRCVGPTGPVGTIPSAEVLFFIAVCWACLLSQRMLTERQHLRKELMVPT